LKAHSHFFGSIFYDGVLIFGTPQKQTTFKLDKTKERLTHRYLIMGKNIDKERKLKEGC